MDSVDLWNQVHECFDTDDGSLPGIVIANLSPDGVTAIYSLLRGRSRLHVGKGVPEFWSKELNASASIDSAQNAGQLVALGKAEAFHIGIEGVVAAGVILPFLGVFVRKASITLDYRMGSEWQAAQVAGFFELLLDCCLLYSNALVFPDEFEGPPFSERFVQAWAAYYA